MTELRLTDESGDEAVSRALDALLQADMEAATGRHDYAPLTLAVRDDAGRLVAGLDAFTWGGWLYIETLVVEAPLRGQGWGTRLLDRAEAMARERGCTHATLETHSFQARPLYEARGYRVFGTLQDYPPGHELHYLHKAL